MEHTSGSYIVSWSFHGGKDVGILLVGERTVNGETKIVNAFKGDKAYEIYKKLSTVKKGE